VKCPGISGEGAGTRADLIDLCVPEGRGALDTPHQRDCPTDCNTTLCNDFVFREVGWWAGWELGSDEARWRLRSISAENNSTIIFPVPIDIISQMMNNSSKRVNTQVQYFGNSV
jgi:hypothetical protein